MDRNRLGRLVLGIGVILLLLRWVIPLVSDVELSSIAGLLMSVCAAVAIFIGGTLLYWPNRHDDGGR